VTNLDSPSAASDRLVLWPMDSHPLELRAMDSLSFPVRDSFALLGWLAHGIGNGTCCAAAVTVTAPGWVEQGHGARSHCAESAGAVGAVGAVG
jgi:hypothetical protein